MALLLADRRHRRSPRRGPSTRQRRAARVLQVQTGRRDDDLRRRPARFTAAVGRDPRRRHRGRPARRSHREWRQLGQVPRRHARRLHGAQGVGPSGPVASGRRRARHVEIWTEPRIREERLGGSWAWARVRPSPVASSTPPTTRTPTSNCPHIALVGKGVTFDSGGLSLKTGEGMMTMKTDMSRRRDRAWRRSRSRAASRSR